MNRSKRSMTAKLRKKMTKTIRDSQVGLLSPEGMKQQDKQTAKEIQAKFPKKPDKKKAALLEAMKKKIRFAKTKATTKASKRTTPGSQHVDDFAPSDTHREGKRWMKTIIKQNLSDRVVADHRGRKK